MDKEEILSAELENSQARLWAVVRALVLPSSREEAMDVLQNVNAAILAHADLYDPKRPAWLWFRAIAFNEVKKWRQSRQRSRILLEPDALENAIEEVSEVVVEDARRKVALRRCLAKVPANKRGLLMERYSSGKSVNELAK